MRAGKAHEWICGKNARAGGAANLDVPKHLALALVAAALRRATRTTRSGGGGGGGGARNGDGPVQRLLSAPFSLAGALAGSVVGAVPRFAR